MFAGSMAARRAHQAAAPILKNMAATALYIDMIKRRTVAPMFGASVFVELLAVYVEKGNTFMSIEKQPLIRVMGGL